MPYPASHSTRPAAVRQRSFGLEAAFLLEPRIHLHAAGSCAAGGWPRRSQLQRLTGRGQCRARRADPSRAASTQPGSQGRPGARSPAEPTALPSVSRAASAASRGTLRRAAPRPRSGHGRRRCRRRRTCDAERTAELRARLRDPRGSTRPLGGPAPTIRSAASVYTGRETECEDDWILSPGWRARTRRRPG